MATQNAKPQKPRLTSAVFDGLDTIVNAAEAAGGELEYLQRGSFDTPEEYRRAMRNHDAAIRWIAEMAYYREQAKRSKGKKS